MAIIANFWRDGRVAKYTVSERRNWKRYVGSNPTLSAIYVVALIKDYNETIYSYFRRRS